MRAICALLLLACDSVAAADGGQAVTLPVVVMVGRPAASSAPASLDRIDAAEARGWPGVQVSGLLQRVPGVAAHDRQNLAQDVQLTVRGFGARTTFGVRGLRIYVDGIPATMPDGQGQLSHVPLSALGSLEVLRGPFSALYGNAAGGVVRFTSKPPSQRATGTLSASMGSDDTRNMVAGASGPWRDGREGGYRVDVERLDAGGFRRHSQARRDVAQARLTWRTVAGTDLALTANRLELRAQDPQGLDLRDALADPRAASAGALAFDARKQVRQGQAGLRMERDAGASGLLALGVYGGTRATWQMLSVPVQAQAAPGSGGGVVDLDRDYGGADLRWNWRGKLASRPIVAAAGVEWQQSSERRRGYENFAGDMLGVAGALRRDQRDATTGRDAFAELHWGFLPNWEATLGLRRSEVSFRSKDHYIASGNPDDSGALDYAFTTPVAGLLYRPSAGVEAYVDAGRGFETPSASELAYRPDGGSGLNAALRPARTRSVEAGVRIRRGARQFGAAAFVARTRDELVVASNQGGRSTYANAARSWRSGFELSASGPVGGTWHYALAWTALDARYVAGFTSCRAPPCATPDTRVAGGNRIPATSARTAWAELRWSPREDIELFADGQGNSRTWADDGNTAYAPGHATVDLGLEWRARTRPLTFFARVDNVLDRRTIGSVIVNDGNGRYFEPAPGRGLTLGIRAGGDAIAGDAGDEAK